MSESEPSRLQMSASSMGMGGSLPPLSLPPLSLPPMKTDQLGLSPMSLSYPSAISQPMHSPIPTNITSPSNHVGSPHTPQMFAQPPSSPLAYGNGSPRQVTVKRRFPTGQEQPVLVFQQPRPPIEKFNGTEPTAKQIKSVPGSPNSGSNPSTPGAIPTRYNNMEAAPSPSAIACSSSGMPSPSPSMSPSMPNGNGPVHSQAQPVQSGNIPASPSSSCMVQAPQPQQNVPVSLSMEYRGMPNGTLGSNDLPPSISLYHKPRMSEALGQGLPPVHHIQMRPTTSQYPQTVHPGHPNLGNLQNNQPGMHPHQQMIHVQSQQHAFQQGLPSGHQQPGTVHYPSGHPAGPPPQRLPLQHQQIAMHHAMMQQRMAQGGMVPIAVSQPPSQQQQQSAITQQQIKQLLANRLNTNQVMPPGVPTTPLTQLQVLTRPVATPQQRLHPGAVVHGQLHPSQANIPVRSILAAQHQVPNGRPPPGATVAMPLQMMTNAGQPLVHPGIVAQRPNPSASLQLARLIDERMAPTTSSKEQYRMYKRKFKYLVFENECYQEELRNLQRKLLKLSRDKNFLLDRLMQFEKVSDSSDDDSDSSHKTVDDRPKTKKRIRTQRRRTSPHERTNNDGVGSVSGSPSPCPSPASGNLLAQMLQQSTSGIHIPFGDGRVPNVDQMQARSEERKPFIQSPVPTEEVKQPLTHEGPPVTCDPAVNGYSSETFTPGGSQSQIVPGTQAQSHLNGMLPSNMDVSSPKDEELDEKPVV